MQEPGTYIKVIICFLEWGDRFWKFETGVSVIGK